MHHTAPYCTNMMNGAGLLWSEIRYDEQRGIADGHVTKLRAVEFERSPILSGEV